jgi:hypothetical protein
MRVVNFPNARIAVAEQRTVDVAAQNIRSGVCDFVIAINDTQTCEDALNLRLLIGELLLELGAAENIALDRADRLCAVPCIYCNTRRSDKLYEPYCGPECAHDARRD